MVEFHVRVLSCWFDELEDVQEYRGIVIAVGGRGADFTCPVFCIDAAACDDDVINNRAGSAGDFTADIFIGIFSKRDLSA